MTDAERSAIKDGLDLEGYFTEAVGQLRGRGEWRDVACPFHDDTNPSMGVSVETGGFRCHACDASGDIFDFHGRLNGLSFPAASRELAARAGVTLGGSPTPGHPVVPREVVDAYHEALLRDREALEYAITERGWSDEVIRELKIGWDGERYTIPIRTDSGEYANLRRYKPRATANKVLSYRRGFGVARLFPLDAVFADDEVIWVVEGEADCLRALSLGLNAVTSTGGAGSWNKDWSVLFAGRRVLVAYDADEAGRAGSASIAARIAPHAVSVEMVRFPEGMDLTEYMADHTRADLLALPRDEAAPMVVVGPETPTPRPGFRSDGSYGRTDTGNAARLADLHGNELKYVPTFNAFLAYEDGRWVRDDRERAMHLAKQAIREMYREAAEMPDADEAAKMAKHAIQSESTAKLRATLANAQEVLAVTPADLDANPDLFNVENGTLDLRTFDLRPHDPRDLITRKSKVEYDPAAEAPDFQEFLRWATQERGELADFIQDLVGQSLVGRVDHHVLGLLVGSGANGKSTFSELMLDLHGEYGVHAPPGLLNAKRQESHPADKARLRGARLAVAAEIDEGQRLAEATVKQLTGGDTISARGMRENFYDFRPSHTLLMHVNHKPVIKGTDLGIWRRIALIPFDATIEEPDTELPNRLREELSGILNWALEGCRRVQERGLVLPEIVRVATDEYRAEMDDVGAFLDDRCRLGTYEQVKKGTVYDAYEKWCEDSSREPKSKNSLGAVLGQRFDTVRTGQARYWSGLSLRDPDDG